MICEKCGKRQATVHIKTMVNGVYMEQHLCSECATDHGSGFDTLNKAGFISSMFGRGSAAKRCANCGLTENQFLKSGYLGCSQCYETFKDSVESVIRKVQGSTAHIGRTPSPVSVPQTELEKLTDELARAVKEEDYKKAAILRDKIKSLKEGI